VFLKENPECEVLKARNREAYDDMLKMYYEEEKKRQLRKQLKLLVDVKLNNLLQGNLRL